jgi:nitroreductase
MELLHAIYHRRSVRHFTDVPVHPAMIQDLLRAAVQAPSAINQQPWAFAVIRGRERLDRYSERAKAHLLAILPELLDLHQRTDVLASRGYNVFHHADTLVVIYAEPARHHPVDDCLLAAQNLMLAAHGLGLGTCPIGFARPWFNLGETKAELGIPEDFIAVMPLVVGWPAGVPAAPPRHEPNIVCWIDDHHAP